jgi:hypothetical protein
VLPAYDHVLKASHLFNLMDARGAIAVAERQSYIGRIRDLCKACASAWVEQERERRPDARPPARNCSRRDPRAHAGPAARDLQRLSDASCAARLGPDPRYAGPRA